MAENAHADVPLKKVAVVPHCPSGANITFSEMRIKYPFSFELVLTCYKRLYEGKEYPTAIHEHSKEMAAEMLFAFAKLYESVDFSLPLLTKYGFHHVLPLDFSNYATEQPVGENMKELVVKILQRTDSNGCSDKKLVKDFVALFELEYMKSIHDDERAIDKAVTVYEDFLNSISEKCSVVGMPEKRTGSSRMKRIPKFVGAEILHSEYPKVNSMLLTGLTAIQTKYFGAGESDIDSLISSIQDKSLWKDNLNWRVPSFWHVTSYYIGKKNAAPDSDYLRKFKEQVEVDINCEVLVYVPQRLVMGILRCPEIPLQQSYKVPSAVWLLNKGNMIFAREVCEQLFEDSKRLYSQYLSGFFRTPQHFSAVYPLEVGKEESQCYITKLHPSTAIKATTKFFYS